MKAKYQENRSLFRSVFFWISAVFLLYAIFIPNCIAAESLPWKSIDAAEVLQNSSLLGKAERVEYSAVMEITAARGKKTRKIEIFREQTADNEFKLLAQVVYPTFLNNMKLLIIHEDNTESKWMKTSRGVRTIADSGRDEQLFDSDLSSEDLNRIDPEHFTLSFKPSEQISEQKETCIEAAEKNSKRKRIIYINDENLITRIEYFDSNNELYKLYRLNETILVEGILFPLKSTISHPLEGTSTVLSFENIDLPKRISNRIFNRYQL